MHLFKIYECGIYINLNRVESISINKEGKWKIVMFNGDFFCITKEIHEEICSFMDR